MTEKVSTTLQPISNEAIRAGAQRNTFVQTTEEYNLLAEAIKEQGGYITHANEMYNGLSVQYIIPMWAEALEK